MKRITSFLICLLIGTSGFAQKKQKAAWYDQDSIIAMHPQKRAIEDSLLHYNENLVKTLWRLDSAVIIDSIILAQNSSKESTDTLAMRKAKLQASKDIRTAYIKNSSAEAKSIREQLYGDLRTTIHNAALQVATQRGYTILYTSLPEAVIAQPKDYNPYVHDLTVAICVYLNIVIPKPKPK